ncbi:serine/threonine-protein kinase [Coleofasciculus sp. FACHB-SPT9]|uniref:serine/threonine-protein kinase n=2 Tax=Cyanobacteriota TaxID=1117 RepID=UPI001688460D|nr:serine/threonine-protein kinase [Coleofasciculus sp. FACHB-SPT9]MBD1890611.1 serine/threonine protein kinase [Coleofasciculus sp. FACHB-SPT9]
MPKNTATDDLSASVNHPMLGRLLDGRYQIIDSLGRGGFGQTYIAQDTRRPGNPTCVVKHLKPASSDSECLQIARRLFCSEAEILEKLGYHDQIPRLLAYFEENQEFYLVQEFIEGQLLSEELQPGHCWSESQVIQLLGEVLSILEFVHSYEVIHRDIKPDNLIRRNRDKKLVLIDFGTVKQVRTQLVVPPEQPNITVAIGTTGYMPTEQGQGKPRPNSDIYALGIIGIQALTGLNPTQFQEDSGTGELLWQQQVQISSGLKAVLTKMVRYHFKDRHQSVAETLQALQQSTNINSSAQIANPPKFQRTEIATRPRLPTEIVTSPQSPAPSVPQPAPELSDQNAPPISNQPSEKIDSPIEHPRILLRPYKVKSKKDTRRFPNLIKGFTAYQKISLLLGAGLITAGIAIFSIFIVGFGSRYQSRNSSTLTVPLEEFLVDTLTSASTSESVAFSSDGKTLVTGSIDQIVRVWDLKAENSNQTLSDHSGRVYDVAVSPDGQTLASGSEDNTIKIWNLHTGELLRTLKGHLWSVLSVAISPDGQTLASGGEDNTIKIWNLKTGKLLNTLSGYTSAFSSVEIGADGRLLAGGSLDNTIKIWELHTGKLLHILRGHSGQVNSVAIASNSAILASGSTDGTIKIWNLHTGELLHSLTGHLDSVESVAISPDSQKLVSGGKDGILRIWNLHTGDLIHTFFGNANPIHAVVFSPDGQTIASSSQDKTIKIWQVP